MSKRSAEPVATWLISPEKFPHLARFAPGTGATFVLLALLFVAGFGLRAWDLSAEALSEDELNKLQAVADYREFGLSPANAEHPMLMKALQTASVVMCESWNEYVWKRDEDLSFSPVDALQESARRRKERQTSNADAVAIGNPHGDTSRIQPETALRLPGVIFGALTTLLIFFVARALFGTSTGLLAAALWALDPTAIGFNRIAKEDTFFVFFFLLANVFWLKAQARAERQTGSFDPMFWAASACFGAMVASKYYPHFMAISGAYYFVFVGLPTTRFHLGKRRWLIFFLLVGVFFLLCNLTILLPGTWAEMRTFATERRIGHDAYEYLGALYPNQLSKWLAGVPWTFYFVLAFVKHIPVAVLGIVVGVPLLFMRRTGDGRYFLLFWFLLFFMPFSVFGGKFARYYTLVVPAMLIAAAIGLHFLTSLVIDRLAPPRRTTETTRERIAAALFFVVIAASAYASSGVAPHFRLYNNILGGGVARAGDYFPHDDFYDASMRDAADIIARDAAPDARVASESPRLFLHYAALSGRTDLRAVSLSDSAARVELQPGDYVIDARGRRYFSNDAVLRALRTNAPAFELNLGDVPSAKIFRLDANSIDAVRR